MKARSAQPRALTWLGRALGLDRNPLRRGTDRAEAWTTSHPLSRPPPILPGHRRADARPSGPPGHARHRGPAPRGPGSATGGAAAVTEGFGQRLAVRPLHTHQHRLGHFPERLPRLAAREASRHQARHLPEAVLPHLLRYGCLYGRRILLCCHRRSLSRRPPPCQRPPTPLTSEDLTWATFWP